MILTAAWWATWKTRILIGAGALLAISSGLAFKAWLNKRDDRMFQEGKPAIANDLKDAALKEIGAERVKIAAERAQAGIDAAKAAAVLAQVKKGQQVLADLRNQNRAAIDAAREASREKARAVAPSDLDAALRAQSERVAATERADDPAVVAPH